MSDPVNAGLVRVRTFGMINRRGFIASTGAAIGAGLIGGRANPAWASTTVTFVGWQGYDTPLADYAKAHDIAIDPTYIGDSNQIISKLNSGGVGTVDIVTPNATYVPVLVKLNTLSQIDESKIPNLSKVMPFFLNNPAVRIDGKLYAVPYCWGGVPLTYDPSAVTTPPDSWKDVLKPEYSGKIAIIDNLNNIQLAARVVTDAKIPTRLTADQLKASVDFLIAVKKQARVVAATYGDMADAMARGEVVMTFNGSEEMVNMGKKKGKTIAYVYPKEGTFGWCDCFCIVRDAPNADLAHALANEAIDVPAQLKAGANDAIVNTDAIAQLPADTRAIFPYDHIEDFSKRAGFYPVPPFKPDGDIVSFDDWKKEYLRFKNA